MFFFALKKHSSEMEHCEHVSKLREEKFVRNTFFTEFLSHEYSIPLRLIYSTFLGDIVYRSLIHQTLFILTIEMSAEKWKQTCCRQKNMYLHQSYPLFTWIPIARHSCRVLCGFDFVFLSFSKRKPSNQFYTHIP